MMERDPKVGENTVKVLNAVISHEISDEPEIGMYESEARIIGSVDFGVDVAVETIEMSIVVKFGEDGAGMAAAAKRDVGIDAVGVYVEGFDSFGQEGRYMVIDVSHYRKWV